MSQIEANDGKIKIIFVQKLFFSKSCDRRLCLRTGFANGAIAAVVMADCVRSSCFVEGSASGVALMWAGLNAPSSFPRSAPFITLQREQDLRRLAPKRALIAAQPVKRTGLQVGQADKGAREIVGWICRLLGR